jgi:hypothetical protein
VITLVSTTQKLQAVLGGSSSSTGAHINVSWYDENIEGVDTKQGAKQTTSNNTTDVDICLAPQQSFIRNIEYISVYNADTITATVTIKIDDGGTETILVRAALATLEGLYYDNQSGWYALTSAGARK